MKRVTMHNKLTWLRGPLISNVRVQWSRFSRKVMNLLELANHYVIVVSIYVYRGFN